ncbi:MAG: type II toxin-antitoxin system VapC family toxin [Chloroflexi bacterium]|nr:type II toxin-antitoxin system VapC family toxin [Chloroflexota bacterium]
MVTFYLDTSALLKLYVNETGSTWLRRTITTSNEIVLVTTEILIEEVISALNRCVRDETVTQDEYRRLAGGFRYDCHNRYNFIAFKDTIIDTVWNLLERHPLRAYDAVHLSTAINVNQWMVLENEAPITFLSADDRLNQAAAKEGLLADNPNNHP